MIKVIVKNGEIQSFKKPVGLPKEAIRYRSQVSKHLKEYLLAPHARGLLAYFDPVEIESLRQQGFMAEAIAYRMANALGQAGWCY